MDSVKVDASTDLEIAQKMESGEINAIVPTKEYLLVPMRITGTGVTERIQTNEDGTETTYKIDRRAEDFLTDDFLKRCYGLPVIFLHPENKEKVNYTNYNDYAIGSIFHPFIKDDEVWGVAKIYNLEILDAIQKGFNSTSPHVTSLNVTDGDEVYEDLKDINHVAIVPVGHWDNEKPAMATEILIMEDDMNEEEMKAKIDELEKEKADMLEKCDALQQKVDEFEKTSETKVEEKEKTDIDETADVKAMFDEIKALLDGNKPSEEKVDDTPDPMLDTLVKLQGLNDLLNARWEDVQAKMAEIALNTATQETVVEDEVIDETEEAEKVEVVEAITEMADSANSEINFKRPRPKAGEKPSELINRVLALNPELVSDKYKSLKVDAGTLAIGKDALEEMKKSIFAKNKELEKVDHSQGYRMTSSGKKVYSVRGGI